MKEDKRELYRVLNGAFLNLFLFLALVFYLFLYERVTHVLTERTSSYLPLYFGKEGKAFGVSAGAFIRCCHSFESCMLNKEKIWNEKLVCNN